MIKVYKYGGSILKKENNRKKIYKQLQKEIKKGNKVFMVVSAFGRKNDSFSTDNLSKNTNFLDEHQKDRIVTFGEIYSSLTIKNEMLKNNIKVQSVDYNEIGIKCDNNYGNGNILNIDMSYLEKLINLFDIVIVPGFIGESLEGKIISLGRNTSDLTALLIANYFKIDTVNIIKDVDGVYKKDPRICKTEDLLNNISYEEMIFIIQAGSKMFALKSIEYAKDKNIKIQINGLDRDNGTLISEQESNEKLVFINKIDDEFQVVVKNMDVFNEIFNLLVKEKVEFTDLIINKNIVYVKGNENKINVLLERLMK